MSAPIDVTNDQLRQLHSLLQKFIPDIVVWAYGSRVKWTARQNSDLDLIVFSTPDGKERVAELRDAFAESDLPFLIDVHIWDEVPEVFHEIIRQQYVVLQDAAGVIGKRNSLAAVHDGWDMLPLLDCTSDRQISYGIVQPDSDESDGVPIVRVNNLTSSGIETRGAMRVAGQIEKSYLRTRLKGGELLLSLVGTTGNVAIVPPELEGWNVARAIAVIRPREDIGPAWLKVCLESAQAREYLDARANTTVQKTLNLGDVKKLPIPLPPRAWRSEILSLLSPLDDAIAALRTEIKTLESLARAIFKSWLVDFDPVRAKAEGLEPEGMDAATAALLPHAVITSSNRHHPEGWSTMPLDSIASFLNGLALQKYPALPDEESLPAIKIAQLKKGSAEGADRISPTLPPQYLVHDGDLIFSWSGSLEVELWCGGVGALNQHLFKVTSESYPQWFVYGWLREHLEHFREIAASKVTTMGHIQRHHLKEALVVSPPQPTLERLGLVMEPLHNRIIVARLQMRTLADLRNMLLPRLISGKLRIPEVENLVEAVR